MSEVKIQKKRTFKKYTFRGVDLDQLLDMKSGKFFEFISVSRTNSIGTYSADL